MVRKDRSDATVKKIAEKHNIPEEAFRNPNGTKTKKNKTLGAIRKESPKLK